MWIIRDHKLQLHHQVAGSTGATSRNLSLHPDEALLPLVFVLVAFLDASTDVDDEPPSYEQSISVTISRIRLPRMGSQSNLEAPA